MTSNELYMSVAGWKGLVYVYVTNQPINHEGGR